MASKTNQVRIIAGQWRGRKIAFPDAEGLRPSADRIRETLFNWLAPVVPGARCLDLFAGSGALGFEAASRGAAEVVMVERDTRVFAALEAARRQLDAGNIELVHDDALGYLAGSPRAFDVVFLDPPFADGTLLRSAIAALDAAALVRPGGYVYLETAKAGGLPRLPVHWVPYREKQAGQVDYRLLTCDAAE